MALSKCNQGSLKKLRLLKTECTMIILILLCLTGVISSYEVPSLNRTSENEPEEAINNSDCTLNVTEAQEHLMKIKDVINKAEIEMENRYIETVTSTILVLGNPGVGKTTFVKFMTQDESNLTAKEIDDSGDFLIEGTGIGESDTDSLTLYPETVLMNNSPISFTDTPGFSDTRSKSHELVATYTMKEYLKNIKYVKIVLLVPYESLKKRGYRRDFLDLLENVNSFIENIEDFNNSIVMIATKVPQKFKYKGENVTEIPEKKMISNIVEYIFSVTISLKEKLQNTDETYERMLLTNTIKILELLQEIDENGSYKRINLFHRPREEGTISSFSLFQDNKKSLENTVFGNIGYSKLSYEKLGYALSYKAKVYLNCLLKYTNERITNVSDQVFKSLESYFKRQLQFHTNIYDINISLKQILTELKNLKNYLKESLNYSDYLGKLEHVIMNKYISYDISFEITETQNYIKNIQPFTNIYPSLSIITWSEQINNVLNYIEDTYAWNNFLIYIFERFSSYEIQSSKQVYYNETSTNIKTTEFLQTILSSFYPSSHENFSKNLNILLKNKQRISEIENILSITLKTKNTIVCQSDGKLIATGYFINLNEFNVDSIKQLCEDKPLKTIEINALHTLFIDADIDDEYYKGTNLMVGAPKWEIIGSRKINLEGSNGKLHNETQASNGIAVGESGEDGKPGLPGGNGGNFMGIGLHFVNGENLIISVRGGEGGSGQHGGNGQRGKNGTNGKEKYLNFTSSANSSYSDLINEGYKSNPYESTIKIESTQFSKSPISSVLHGGYCQNVRCNSETYVYTQSGDCGSEGGKGGDGGIGGIGGYPGNVYLNKQKNYEIFEIFEIDVDYSPGGTGRFGLGGLGGNKGLTGKPMTCFKIILDNGNQETFWECKEWYLQEKQKECEEQRNEDGKTGYNIVDILEPNKPVVYDFVTELHNYLTFLKNHEANQLISKYIKEMQREILENISIQNHYLRDFILLSKTI